MARWNSYVERAAARRNVRHDVTVMGCASADYSPRSWTSVSRDHRRRREKSLVGLIDPDVACFIPHNENVERESEECQSVDLTQPRLVYPTFYKRQIILHRTNAETKAEV